MPLRHFLAGPETWPPASELRSILRLGWPAPASHVWWFAWFSQPAAGAAAAGAAGASAVAPRVVTAPSSSVASRARAVWVRLVACPISLIPILLLPRPG